MAGRCARALGEARCMAPRSLIAAAALLALAAHADIGAIPPNGDVPVCVDPSVAWSWAGVPEGAFEAAGVAFSLPEREPDGPRLRVATEAVLPAGSHTVWVLASPVVEIGLFSAAFQTPSGETRVAGADGGLAWAGPAPANRRLLVFRASSADGIDRVRVSGGYLWGLAAGDASSSSDPALSRAFDAAHAEWAARLPSELSPSERLRGAVGDIPEGKIAFLPPMGAVPQPLARALSRTGLDRKLGRLLASDLPVAGRLTPARFPVLLSSADERYLRSLEQPDDQASAVIRYLAEGGALIVASSGPYPLYYATDAWIPALIGGDAFLERIGITLTAGWERPPEGATIGPVEGQTVLPSLTEPYSYPTTVDQRLRCLGPKPGSGVEMQPLAVVRTADGATVGACAALFTLPGPEPRGRLLYLWSGMACDDRHGEALMADAIALAVARVKEATR